MAGTAYGIGSADYKARPDFTARRDEKGAWSASNSFSMLRDTWENTARGLFAKGVAITTLYPELPEYWSFLFLEEVEVTHQPGAFTIVRCQWLGISEEDEERVYTLSGTRVDRSIIHHPLLRHQILDNPDKADKIKDIMNGAVNGVWRINQKNAAGGGMVLINNADAADQEGLEDEDAIVWLRKILRDGHKTYKAPALQWTEDKSSKLGWNDEDTNFLGLIEFKDTKRPPGNPPQPIFGVYNWLKISMNQNTTNGLTTQSQTWELSPPGGFDELLYGYDPSELAEKKGGL